MYSAFFKGARQAALLKAGALSLNLRQSSNQSTEIDLAALLDELSIVISPSLLEENIAAQWTIEPDLPLVWADRSSLMQALLNLTTNSIRALARGKDRVLSISARSEGSQILVECTDNGGGVAHPEQLFRLFQVGAEATGLGLYLSRAFVCSFGGELRYLPIPDGACFVVHLTPASQSEQD